jgi:hypothetical protein
MSDTWCRVHVLGQGKHQKASQPWVKWVPVTSIIALYNYQSPYDHYKITTSFEVDNAASKRYEAYVLDGDTHFMVILTAF